ncbi:hypothetical protein D9M71_709480 [compost metagenome]
MSLDENAFEICSWCAPKTFTVKILLSRKCACELADWFIHTNNVGGVSVTLQTAEAVNPKRPDMPAVVTTLTALVSKDIAFLKSVA